MDIRKTMLLGTALTVVAMVAPAASPAAQLRDEGTPVPAGTEVHLEGTFGFESLGSGIECPVTSVLEANSSSEGEVTEFDIEPAQCEGFGAIFEGCVLEHIELTGPSGSGNTVTAHWPFVILAVRFGLSNITMHLRMNSTCTVKGLTLNSHEVEAELTPSDPKALSSAVLSGEGIAETELGELPMALFGQLSISPAGTYEIS